MADPVWESFGASTPSPAPASPAQPSRGFWDRFKDAYSGSAQEGLEGFIARHALELAGHDPAKVVEAQRGLRQEYEDKAKADPWYESNRSLIDNGINGAATFLGHALGNPENLIGAGGEGAAAKIVRQAMLGGGINAVSQGADVAEGVRDEFSPGEVATNALVAGGLGAAHIGAGKLINKLKGPKEGVPEVSTTPVWEDFGAPAKGTATPEWSATDLSRGWRRKDGEIEFAPKDKTTSPLDQTEGMVVDPVTGEQRLRVQIRGGVPEPVTAIEAVGERNGIPIDKNGQPVAASTAEGYSDTLNYDDGRPSADLHWRTTRGLEELLRSKGVPEDIITATNTMAHPDLQVPSKEVSPVNLGENVNAPAEPPVIQKGGDLTSPPQEGGSSGDGTPPSTERPAFDILREALKDIEPIRAERTAEISRIRKDRYGKLMQAQAEGSGEAGFYNELSQLKGQMGDPQFYGIREKFTQEHLDDLFNAVRDSEHLTGFDKVTARTGLSKLLGSNAGSLPTENELRLLSEVLPKDIVEKLKPDNPQFATLRDHIANGLNLPRSIMSSSDLSAPFRQGLGLVHKKEFWSSFGSMFKQFASEDAHKAAQEAVRADRNYPLMVQGKLAVTKVDGKLSEREEAFMSPLAEKIPVVGKLVRASDRAYTGFLNKVRADTFSNLIDSARKAGLDVDGNKKLVNDIAKFVNTATGRGDFGKYNNAVPLLNTTLFSPRLIASRMNMLNPVYYVKLDPFARKEAIKSLLGVGAFASTALGLAKLSGAEVEIDPRSSDFAKAKIGKTRIDPLGGIQQYLRLAAQLATNEKKTTTKGEVQELGKKFGSKDAYGVLTDFVRNKLAPIPSAMVDLRTGKNSVGQPVTVKSAIEDRFIPLFIQDYLDVVKEEGAAKGTAMAVPGLFGMGVSTYKDYPKKGKQSTNQPVWENF